MPESDRLARFSAKALKPVNTDLFDIVKIRQQGILVPKCFLSLALAKSVVKREIVELRRAAVGKRDKANASKSDIACT